MTFYKSIGLSEKPHCYKTEDRAVFLNFGKVEILEMFHRTVVYIVNTCIEYNMHTSLVNDVIYYAFFFTNLLLSACYYAFTVDVYK